MPHVRGTSHPKVFLERAFPSSTALHPPVLEPTSSRHRQRPVTVSQQFALPRSRAWLAVTLGLPRSPPQTRRLPGPAAGRKERPRPQRSHPRSARWPSREKSANTREIPRDSLQQSEQPKSNGSRVERRKVTSRARSRTGAAAAPGGSGQQPRPGAARTGGRALSLAACCPQPATAARLQHKQPPGSARSRACATAAVGEAGVAAVAPG